AHEFRRAVGFPAQRAAEAAAGPAFRFAHRTRPFIALARALVTTRPAASARKRARTRAFNFSASPGGIALRPGPTLALRRLVAQKSSKLSKLRSTTISLVSIASRPAPVHKSFVACIRDASALGGAPGVRPTARISAIMGSSGNPPPRKSHA